MKLSKSNTFLRSRKTAAKALHLSAQTSSGVEGIRKPFEGKASSIRVADTKAFIAYWKKRRRARSASKSARSRD